MTRTPLEAWIAERARLPRATEECLREYQFNQLRRTLQWARAHGRFYSEHLAEIDEQGVQTLADLAHLPFTTPEDLRAHSSAFLCVSQSEVNRVVTLKTSGTSGESKRIYFTAEDQEAAVDFLHQALRLFADSNDRILILLPAERPGSVGALLAAAVDRLGATPLLSGPIAGDPSRAMAADWKDSVSCIIGLPTDLLFLAREGGARLHPRSVAICGDYASTAIVRVLQETWGCRAFEHYGMTEMGLGGGVDCAAHGGYHMREADLYVEIVDPDTGETVIDGQLGEVVFTTLTRRGMPLIRYRTGDTSRWLATPCPCGSMLRRLDRISARTGGWVRIGARAMICMPDLDEALFGIPGLIDFSAVWGGGERDTLTVTLYGQDPARDGLSARALRALLGIPAIVRAHLAGEIRLKVQVAPAQGTAGGKRQIRCLA